MSNRRATYLVLSFLLVCALLHLLPRHLLTLLLLLLLMPAPLLLLLASKSRRTLRFLLLPGDLELLAELLNIV